MTKPHVCLIGQFIVDVTLPAHGDPYKLRAGGIMHAARALWAIDCEYSLCYCAPDYLASQIVENAKRYGAATARSFGVITGSPNVMLIGEPKEVGDQGYELLLRDVHHCVTDAAAVLDCLESMTPTDALLFPGGFDLPSTLRAVGSTPVNAFADASFDPADASIFGSLGHPFESLIYSTSSRYFIEQYAGRFDTLRSVVGEVRQQRDAEGE